MKKLILMISAIAFIANFSSAQENNNTSENTDFREQLQIGMKIGVNYSNVYDAQGEQFNADSKLGFVFGGFVSIPIGKYIGIQPEVLFSQKGFKATGSILGLNYTFTRTSNFVDIPILFQLKPTSGLTFLIGPQYSYLVKQTDVFGNISMEQNFDNEDIRKNILCFLGGADVNLDHLVFSARVGWDVTKNNGDGTSTTPRYKNVWYQAMLGFRF